jgi:hypothetical protein
MDHFFERVIDLVENGAPAAALTFPVTVPKTGKVVQASVGYGVAIQVMRTFYAHVAGLRNGSGYDGGGVCDNIDYVTRSSLPQ